MAPASRPVDARSRETGEEDGRRVLAQALLARDVEGEWERDIAKNSGMSVARVLWRRLGDDRRGRQHTDFERNGNYSQY
jgi:hypothetical protein